MCVLYAYMMPYVTLHYVCCLFITDLVIVCIPIVCLRLTIFFLMCVVCVYRDRVVRVVDPQVLLYDMHVYAYFLMLLATQNSALQSSNGYMCLC